MSLAVLLKLLAIFVIVALGWLSGRLGWLGPRHDQGDPSRVLSAAALYLFVPALLFRTTARIDLSTLPWSNLAAFFVPVVALMLAVYALLRPAAAGGPAGPAVRAITVAFGNTVQIGVPVAAALFGEAGLGIHITLVSVHALTLLTVMTALVEHDLARSRRASGASNAHLAAMLGRTARATLIHPVVLPVVAGLAWNLAALPLPALADEVLRTLGQAVVPVCLLLIGLSLAYQSVRSALRAATVLTLAKLLLVPAVVLVVAHWGFGLVGTPLAVLTLCAALPAGSNTLIFAQRYRTLEAEATAAIVLSTLGYAATAPLWLWAAARLGAPG